MGLAIAEALDAGGKRIGLKWPNDLVIDDAKVAGVLAELDLSTAAQPAVVVGIGINLTWPGPPEVGGTCLLDATGVTVIRDELLELLKADASLEDLPQSAAVSEEDLDRILDQETSDPLATMLRGHMHRLELGADATASLEVLNDDQLDDPNHLGFALRHEDLRRTSAEGTDHRCVGRRILRVLGPWMQ